MTVSNDASRPRTRRGVPLRVTYAACIFTPIALAYFVPLVFYRLPLTIPLYDHLTTVGTPDVVRAVEVCVVWFGLAVAAVLVPVGRGDAMPRVWTPESCWQAFLAFSVVGGVVAPLHLMFRAPVAVEELAQQLTVLPAVGVVLGTYLLRRVRRGIVPARGTLLIQVLIAVNMVVAIVPPILLSEVAPAAFSVIAMLYGWNAIGWSWRRLAVAVVVLGMIVVAAIPARQFLRDTVYGHATYQRATLSVWLRNAPRASTATSGPPPQTAAGAGGLLAEAIQCTQQAQVRLRLPALPGWFRPATCGLKEAIDRFNRLSDLAYVIQLTPARIPYVYGATYVPLASALIPRVIWRDKPVDDSGQFYGHRYGFLHPANKTESTNLSMIAEAWLNDGWVGVVLSALFFGIVLWLIWRWWIGESRTFGSVLIGMAIVRTAADGDSDLTLVVSGVLHALLVYWALDVIIRVWGRRPRGLTPR